MNPTTILGILRDRGAMTALEIRQSLRVSHEDVYIALVHLESAGKVKLRIARGDRTGNTWVTA